MGQWVMGQWVMGQFDIGKNAARRSLIAAQRLERSDNPGLAIENVLNAESVNRRTLTLSGLEDFLLRCPRVLAALQPLGCN